MKIFHAGILFFYLFTSANVAMAESRWFNSDQVNRGEILFQQNCAVCHGLNAEAKPGWEQASGEKSAPPLNGSAHAWHHSMGQLSQTIRQGNIQIGGSMPAFKGKLSEQDIKQVIAFFQSKWPDDVYQQWAGENHVVAGKSVSTIEQDVTQLLKLRLGSNDIASATETEIKGVYQTQFGDKYAYLIEGGRYVFIGDLIDLKQARNITEVSRRSDVKKALAEIPPSDLVIYPARGQERTVLNIFTDTSCAYCQKLHSEIGHLQSAGISVHYFPFPRGSSRGPGYKSLKSVWCAKDGMKAMDIAKGVAEGNLPSGNCERSNLVDRGFELGRKIGITGTPALFSANGTKFNGYVPYNELIPMLLNEL
ncbi:MAG: thioredoxin fold domain-containing protein [Gammaproteobacteria bacterium]|nr:thioredoxin fold domain-containing protein [Gammaproteobacteria bacterium]